MEYSLVVLSFLFSCAFAAVYYIPELPCNWTLIWNCTNSNGHTWHVVQQVNGESMRMERANFDGSEWLESVIRSDLDSVPWQFTESSAGHYEKIASSATVKLYKRPFDFNDVELVFAYDYETNDTYYGQECVRYHNSDKNKDFYVGFDGLPIGWVTPGKIFINFTWYDTAPLSWFIFDRSVNFTDERIYTPPNETICPPESSSSFPNPSPSPEPPSSSEPSPSPEPPSSTEPTSSHVVSPLGPSASSSYSLSLTAFVVAMLAFFIAH